MRRLILVMLLVVSAIGIGNCRPEVAPVKELLKQIDKHSEAVFVKAGWIRDPYLILGEDGFYYLTGTAARDDDPRVIENPYRPGYGGGELLVWRSRDLAKWKFVGSVHDVKDTPLPASIEKKPGANKKLWAPEFHRYNGEWVMVHCPQNISALATTKKISAKSEWDFKNVDLFHDRHDPSLFVDNDGEIYFMWGFYKFYISKLKHDFSGFEGEQHELKPSDRSMGHEGTAMYRIGDKYVYVGTAWSTDKMRKGSYNLYYATADSPYGPFSERRFMGRFLGHGTPFVDKYGRWWCTAFFNGNEKPVSSEDIAHVDLSKNALSINEMGTTIVPLQVEILSDGDVYMIAKDPRYSEIGPDEADGENLKRINEELRAKIVK